MISLVFGSTKEPSSFFFFGGDFKGCFPSILGKSVFLPLGWLGFLGFLGFLCVGTSVSQQLKTHVNR